MDDCSSRRTILAVLLAGNATADSSAAAGDKRLTASGNPVERPLVWARMK